MARTQLDVSAIVASIKDGSAPTGLRPTPAVQHGRIGRQPSPKEVADVLGVDQQRLEALMASRPAPVRRPIPVANPAVLASYKESLVWRRAANAIRALPLAPPTTVTLDTPIVIWQTEPHVQSDVFIDAQYTPGDAALLFRVEDVEPDANYRSFVFFYFWENPSEYYAVVNVSTSLVFTGFCGAYSNTGFFSGDLSQVSMEGSLVLIRNGDGATIRSPACPPTARRIRATKQRPRQPSPRCTRRAVESSETLGTSRSHSPRRRSTCRS